MTTETSQTGRDFFVDLMKESQRSRAGHLAERERWLRTLGMDGREEALFELEMLLRGIERFFQVQSAPGTADSPKVARDYSDDLKAVQDALTRVGKLARVLLDPPSDRRLVFRKYVESQVADDRVRRDLMEVSFDQKTPQESLFLLRQGFNALQGVLEQLRRLDTLPLQLFLDVGHLAVREIALNKYFQPFRPLEFRQEYDRIKNVRLLESVNALSAEVRKPLALAFLGHYRLLHYLRYLPGASDVPARRSQVLLPLVGGECVTLCGFLDGEVAAALAKRMPEKAAQVALISHELRKEAARTLRPEPSAARADPPPPGKARDALLQAVRKAIASLGRVLDPSFVEASVFDDRLSRREQARRLRLDLFAYRELCQSAAVVVVGSDVARAEGLLASLRAYLSYFRAVSYQLLRYGDHEPFDRFEALVGETRTVPQGQGLRQRLADDCRAFTDVLDRTYAAICRREDLAQESFDAGEGRKLAETFATRGMR